MSLKISKSLTMADYIYKPSQMRILQKNCQNFQNLGFFCGEKLIFFNKTAWFFSKLLNVGFFLEGVSNGVFP